MLIDEELINMKIPRLKSSNRSREYNFYEDKEKDEIIYKYLFEDKSHRKLDEDTLSLDPDYSRGWQSMGILHYLGIKKELKGIFKKYKIEEVIERLQNEKDENFSEIVNALKRYKEYKVGTYTYKENTIKHEDYIKEFEKSIKSSRELDNDERTDRLKHASKKPRKIKVISSNFVRNPDVVAEVLRRANGFCEYCKKKAPFIRKSDNTPYLEVHHSKPLSEGGEDTVENAVALCPNCHRKAHYGM